MISRRNLLAGFSVLPMAGGLASCAARAMVAPANVPGAAPPLVGPGARWTGAPLSGGTPPADPVRTTAKPAVHWLIPSDQRLVSNLVVGVDADAKGGIARVDFWVEGAVQTVTTASLYADTDANGQPRSRYGYWIMLNAAAFKAMSTTGEARIFATAVPTDSRMQSRVIGYDGYTGLDGNYPLSVFPRTVANDRSYTVRSDGAGGAFTTLAAAINRARSDAAEAPLITIAQTGLYEVTNNAGSPVNYAAGKGFCTITHAPGVTATLGRAATFTPNNPASWPWTPGWDGIEFRGAGIVFDQRNWSTISFTAKPAWMNGCKFTNSIGTLYSYYWNGGKHPGYGASLAGYWDDCTIEHVSIQGALGGQRYVCRCAVKEYADDVFSGTHYVCGNYVRTYDYTSFTGAFQGTNHNGIRIQGPTGATVSKTAADAQGGSLLLRVSGGTVATIPLGFYGNDTNPTIDAVVAAINAFGSGWTASAQGGRGTMRPSQIGTPTGTGGQTFTDLVASSPLNLNAGTDIHGDWWQGYCGASTRENVIIRNNVCRDAVNVNATMNNDDGSNGGHSFDHIVKGNVWLGGYGAMFVGGSGASHYVYENNTGENGIIRIEDVPGDQAYSSFKNNIIGSIGTAPSFNMPQTSDAPFINNVYMVARGMSATTGGANGGNVTYPNPGDNSSINFKTLFRDYANGDVRPALGGGLVANLLATVNTLDGLGIAYSSNDVAGARSINDPAPVYPF